MSITSSQTTYAQLRLPTADLTADMDFLTGLGFRLDKIFPADDPAVAMMSGFNMHIVLDKRVVSPPAIINIITDHPEMVGDGSSKYTAPNGVVFHVLARTQTLIAPSTVHHFEVRKLDKSNPWVIGRAGMLYRDLIPDRLGGSIIASHIHVPDGGPVPDMVHYHTIGFQLIYCYRGWVKLVYEDQGPPFILKAGDCVTQPPEIRHRVLEASDDLHVLEIGVPAAHMTTIDHDMELPTPHFKPERLFQGQRFCHHQLKDAQWIPWRVPGFEYRETGILEATQGDASVQVMRPICENGSFPLSRKREPTQWLRHDTDILFAFVLDGILELKVDGKSVQTLTKGDALVMPPQLKYALRPISDDLEFLEVALPGTFKTQLL
jgi:quercetin dioxygenase-like cupin family protein